MVKVGTAKALEIFRAAFLPRPHVASRDSVDRYLAQARSRATFVRTSFIALVLLPTLIASIYYGLIASARYVSEAQFIVRGLSSPRSSGLDTLFQTLGVSRTVDDANVVEGYLRSRDAVRDLEARLPLRQIFARDEADFFARFPRFWRVPRLWPGDSFEMLYEYYLERVFAVQDTTKGLTRLQVITFRSEDSFQIARALLDLAEGMVNRMNERAERNAVKDALADVALAQQKLITVQLDLTTFRNRELLVDPAQNSLKVLDTMTSLSKELNETLAQIGGGLKTAPANPAITVWEAQVHALRAQVAAERGKLAGDNEALAAKVSEYERLTLVRDLADKELAAAEASLELARQNAERQKIYVEEVIAPNVADESTEPQRLRAIATVFVIGFAAFAMIWLIRAGASEHAL
ncbi:MAG: hypothetical protein ACLQIQ_13920 [Beijerinckiaceae bacterium]